MAISSPDTIAETVEILSKHTSPVRTLTVLQSAGLGVNGFETTNRSFGGLIKQTVNPAGSVASNGDTDIKTYCDDKLQSLSERELQILVEVDEESIAKSLGAKC